MTVSQEMISRLTPENQQRLEWRIRHLEWLLPRIVGTEADVVQFMAMFDAAVDLGFYEGMIEAKSLVEQIAEEIKTPVALPFIAGKIGDLAELNRATAKEGQ